MAIKTDKVTLPEVLEKVIEVGGEVQKAQEDVVEESKRIDEHIADPYAHGLRNQKSPLTVYIQTTVKEALDNGVVNAARRLDTPRGIAISGGVTAPAIAFDGSKDIALSVTGLDVSKANAGTLATVRGGTGRTDGKVTALATARTIAISGAITGAGVAFDGSKNITINTTGLDISKATISGTLTPEKGGTGRTDGKVTAIATKRSFDGINFDGSANVIHYAQCTTSGATAAKTASCTNFVLITGSRITLHFKETNTAANPTLNVNNTGAKTIRYRDTAIPTAYLAGNHTYEFVYDGTNWQIVGDFQRDPAMANPKSPGTAAVGTSTKFAREDHVHPVQTTISGNAGSATKLQTARKINGVTFDGTKDININDFGCNGLTNVYNVEFSGTPTNGGYLDFHFNKDTSDYTSRIIEIAKGNLEINGARIPTGSSGTVLTTTSNLDMSKATGGTLSTARGGTGRTDGKSPALVTARTIDGVNFDGSANITHYGKCTTVAATAAKTVACSGFILATGARITIQFSQNNTAANPTLNVNNTGAKTIRYRDTAIPTAYLAANHTYEFVYDGANWQIVGDFQRDPAMANPKSPGTAAVGTSTRFAREDHVHPVQTTISGNAGSATKLQTARTIDGVNFDGSANITHYGKCTTIATTQVKVVSCTGFVLATGAKITVLFTITNTAVVPMLNVNNTGGKEIKYRNATIDAGALMANMTYDFVYDGSVWQLMGGLDSTADTKSYIDAKATDLSASISSLTTSLSTVSTALTQHNSDTTAHPNINVASAKKLTTARTITLSGAITGSGNFDGSNNLTITTTAASSGPKHTISNASPTGGSNGDIWLQYV